jgi:hypothetical protein
MRDAQARWLNGSRGQGQSSRLRVPTDEEPFSLEIGGLSETCTQLRTADRSHREMSAFSLEFDRASDSPSAIIRSSLSPLPLS